MAPRSNFPISQQFAKTLGEAVHVDFVDLLRTTYQTAIKAAGTAATVDAKAMALAMDGYIKGGGGSRALQSANQRIVDAMRTEVLAAYDESVRPGNGYRTNDGTKWPRYGNGALRRALASPNMFVASYSGISFINQTVLDHEAKHWARLNFGAYPLRGHEGSPPARPGPSPVSLQLFGETVGAIRPYGHPSAAFGIPPGIWVGANVRRSAKGKSAGSTMRWRNKPAGFYPTASGPKKATAGITPRNFFAPAYRVLEEQFPIQYENLVREFADQAVSTLNRKNGPIGLLRNYILEAKAISRYVR